MTTLPLPRPDQLLDASQPMEPLTEADVRAYFGERADAVLAEARAFCRLPDGSLFIDFRSYYGQVPADPGEVTRGVYALLMRGA